MGPAFQPGCTNLKRARPAARCLACPPLFSQDRQGLTVATYEPCSRQLVSQCIKDAAGVSAAGADPLRFSGFLARTGGISTAVEACVEVNILFLQSGTDRPGPRGRISIYAIPGASQSWRLLRPSTCDIHCVLCVALIWSEVCRDLPGVSATELIGAVVPGARGRGPGGQRSSSSRCHHATA